MRSRKRSQPVQKGPEIGIGDIVYWGAPNPATGGAHPLPALVLEGDGKTITLRVFQTNGTQTIAGVTYSPELTAGQWTEKT